MLPYMSAHPARIRIRSLVARVWHRRALQQLPSLLPQNQAPLVRQQFPTVAMASFDVLTATASQVQKLLQGGHVTSEGIAQQYLQHIDKHNGRLRALVEVTPKDRVLSIARQLDEERRAGLTRGPLHGIPIIFKVSEVAWAPMVHPGRIKHGDGILQWPPARCRRDGQLAARRDANDGWFQQQVGIRRLRTLLPCF